MKTKQLLQLILMTCLCGILCIQCEKGGRHFSALDDDSDRPPWAGGNTGLNPHSGKDNAGNGKDNAKEYGDLYVLLRDENGIAAMIELTNPETNETFWVVRPIDEDGNPLELNDEGEVKTPELATEVEFGRLNIIRSPQSVLERAFNEAFTMLEEADSIYLDFCGRLTSYNIEDDGEVIEKTIDSPVENLAIYQYLMQHIPIELQVIPNGVETTNVLRFLHEDYHFKSMELASSCIAAASDKTGTLTIDEIVYINGFEDIVGINPIENPHEFTKTEPDTPKKYFNFSNYDVEGTQFTYDRKATYEKRYVYFKVWDGQYYEEPDEKVGNIMDIYSVMTNPSSVKYDLSFTTYGFTTEIYKRDKVAGFKNAADDAVQVLDMIHEDSNIVYLPHYKPSN